MLRLRFLFLDNNNKKTMSEPGKAFVVHKGKKSGGSMRGPRKSAPPTPKVKPPKKATRFNAATNPSSDTQVYEGMEVIILYNETGSVGHEVKKKAPGHRLGERREQFSDQLDVS